MALKKKGETKIEKKQEKKVKGKIKTTPGKELKGKDLERAAEAESLKTEKASEKIDIEKKKKELLEKAKRLKEKIEVTSTEALKEEIKVTKKKEMLTPLEDYVRSGIYLGTRVVTPNMKPYVYRRRADGLAIFNTDLIDQKLREGVEYLSKFNPEDVILVCKRQSCWKVANKFSEITGIRAFTKKYPAGILTNTELEGFFENELTIITDGWLDKNALRDTLTVKKNVLMICGTNNFTQGADQIIIGNNKSGKSVGLIFCLLARGYCKARKIKADIPDLDWWMEAAEED